MAYRLGDSACKCTVSKAGIPRCPSRHQVAAAGTGLWRERELSTSCIRHQTTTVALQRSEFHCCDLRNSTSLYFSLFAVYTTVRLRLRSSLFGHHIHTAAISCHSCLHHLAFFSSNTNFLVAAYLEQPAFRRFTFAGHDAC